MSVQYMSEQFGDQYDYFGGPFLRRLETLALVRGDYM